jgi:hypothetical protein
MNEYHRAVGADDVPLRRCACGEQTMCRCPVYGPAMEARHLAACRVERIATHILGHLLGCREAASCDTVDRAVSTAMYAARKLAERLR